MKAGVIDDDDGPTIDDFYYLVAHRAGQGRGALRQVRPRLRRLLQGRRDARRLHARTSRSSGCRRSSSSSSSPEEKAKIEKMGWDELMETLKKRFEEQKERHEGGSKMIGTGGTSPFGAYGYNPQGIRIGQDKGRNKQRGEGLGPARRTRTTTTRSELGTRNIKVALRRLRKLRARRRRRRARPRRHDPLDRRQRRLARHQDGARAPQQGEGAAADGRRRHDGRAHPPRRGAVLGRQDRVQAPRVLLLPQLRLRLHVEEQPAPLHARSSRPGTSSASTTRTTS